MSEIATASLNTFGNLLPKDNFVSPSEQLITLTIEHLQGLVKDAVLEAIQPLQDRVSAQDTIIANLQDDLVALKALEDQDIERLWKESTYVNRRIRKLERADEEPTKIEKSRAEKIEKYLKNLPNRSASFEVLRGHLGVNSVLLNGAIKVLMEDQPGIYAIGSSRKDKRKRYLVLLPK